jgi:sRNA-binding carbon storage regulator CsrA
MLCLTRAHGQSVQIGDDMIITHKGVGEDRSAKLYVRRGLIEMDIVLALGESRELMPGIFVSNVDHKGNNTQLGFVAPASVGIFRTEVIGARRRYERTA